MINNSRGLFVWWLTWLHFKVEVGHWHHGKGGHTQGIRHCHLRRCFAYSPSRKKNMAGQPTPPLNVIPSEIRVQYGLIKGNHWLISPDHKAIFPSDFCYFLLNSHLERFFDSSLFRKWHLNWEQSCDRNHSCLEVYKGVMLLSTTCTIKPSF